MEYVIKIEIQVPYPIIFLYSKQNVCLFLYHWFCNHISTILMNRA